jgi:hypothetical protein
VPAQPNHDLRTTALNAFLAQRTAEGCRIETRTDTHAIIAPCPPRLGALLGRVFRKSRSDQRQVVSVDEHGVVTVRAAEPIRW